MKNESKKYPLCHVVDNGGSNLISSSTDSILCFQSVKYLILKIRLHISGGRRSQCKASSSVAVGLRYMAVLVKVWTWVQDSSFLLFTISSSHHAVGKGRFFRRDLICSKTFFWCRKRMLHVLSALSQPIDDLHRCHVTSGGMGVSPLKSLLHSDWSLP